MVAKKRNKLKTVTIIIFHQGVFSEILHVKTKKSAVLDVIRAVRHDHFGLLEPLLNLPYQNEKSCLALISSHLYFVSVVSLSTVNTKSSLFI